MRTRNEALDLFFKLFQTEFSSMIAMVTIKLQRNV